MRNPFILEEAKAPRLTAEEAQEVVLSLQQAGRLTSNQYQQALKKIQEIVSSCNELRLPKYQENPNALAGHCYVAAEALYHLLGGLAQKEWVAANIRHEGDSHWYLKKKGADDVLDPTAGQFSTSVPYEQGKGKGFLTTQPSQRAMVVLKKFFESLEPVAQLFEERGRMAQVSPALLALLKGRNPLTERDGDWLQSTAEWSTDWAAAMGAPNEQRLRKEAQRALVQNPAMHFGDVFCEMVYKNLDAFAFGRPGVRELVRSPRFWQEPEWGLIAGWDALGAAIMKFADQGIVPILLGKVVKTYTFDEAVRNAGGKRGEAVPLPGRPSGLLSSDQVVFPIRLVVFETGVVRVYWPPGQANGEVVQFEPSMSELATVLGLREQTLLRHADR